MSQPDAPLSPEAAQNTDRELWREREGDFYADSIHVTASGAIGMNVGGTVYVLPIREWHRRASSPGAAAPDHIAFAEWVASHYVDTVDRVPITGPVRSYMYDAWREAFRRAGLRSVVPVGAAAGEPTDEQVRAAFVAAFSRPYDALLWSDQGRWQMLKKGIAAALRSAAPVAAPTEAVTDARKALRCLYLAVESDVARDVERKVEAAFAALRVAPDSELAWLIERFDPVQQPSPWYYGGDCGGAWTTDHLKAVRYARREDAERAIMGLPNGWHLIGRAIEHGWARAAVAAPDQQRNYSTGEPCANCGHLWVYHSGDRTGPCTVPDCHGCEGFEASVAAPGAGEAERAAVAEAIGGLMVNLAVMGGGTVPDDWCQRVADAAIAAMRGRA
jgi:hypothetical protein